MCLVELGLKEEPLLRSAIERIVIVSDDSVESGGAASVAIASACVLRRRGFAVTFLTGDEGVSHTLKAAGVDIVAYRGMDIREGPRVTAALRGLYDSGARAFLQSWVSDHDTPRTIYHLHNWHKVLSPAAFAALVGIAPRLFLTTHDYFLACPNGGFSNFPRNSPCDLVPLSTQCLLSNCDKPHYGHKLWRVARHVVRGHLCDLHHTQATVLAVHEAMVPLLQRGGIDLSAIRVLRNPVTPWRATRVEAERNHQVFYVGRLELDKGVDVLARAARIAGVPLTVIGDGALRSVLASQHPEVRLLGSLTKPELAEWIRQARVLVMPTRCRETFGLVAAEALMCGVPVIASTLAPVSDEIVRHGFGLSCAPGDAETLALQLQDIMKDDGAIAEMSKRAFAASRSLAPDLDQWCDELLNLYEDKLLRSNREQIARGALMTAVPV